ncbi:hypothetical protein P3S68_015853 [Capsicum galapagoense]
MDHKLENLNKGSSGTNAWKAKPKETPKASAYTDCIDLPPSDDEEEEVLPRPKEMKEQIDGHKNEGCAIDIISPISYKELQKREKKDMLVVQAAEVAKKEAYRTNKFYGL